MYWRRIPNGSQPQPRPTEVAEAVRVHIPGKRTQAPRKVPVPGARSEKPLSPHPEGVPGPQDDIDLHFLFSTERGDEEKKERKSKERQITEKDLEGKTEEEIEMMKLMGFASFDSTKGKKVDGSVNAYAINVSQKRKYRQYMNP